MGLLWDKDKAVIWDTNGEVADIVGFNKKHETFKWATPTDIKSFVIDPKHASHFRRKGILFDTRYTQYDKDNPLPLEVKQTHKPIINSSILNSLLETKVMKELNDLAKGLSGFAQFFSNPRNLIIMGIIVVVGVYFLSGGTLTAK